VWKHSHVFNRENFFRCGVYPFLFIVSHMCFVLSTCCANLEFGMLVFNDWLCSLKHVCNFLAVCPIYVKMNVLPI
jgi:hypothetical protein